MPDYNEHEKAAVLDELAHALVDIQYADRPAGANPAAWVLGFDGTIRVTKFTATVLRDLMADE